MELTSASEIFSLKICDFHRVFDILVKFGITMCLFLCLDVFVPADSTRPYTPDYEDDKAFAVFQRTSGLVRASINPGDEGRTDFGRFSICDLQCFLSKPRLAMQVSEVAPLGRLGTPVIGSLWALCFFFPMLKFNSKFLSWFFFGEDTRFDFILFLKKVLGLFSSRFSSPKQNHSPPCKPQDEQAELDTHIAFVDGKQLSCAKKGGKRWKIWMWNG